MEDKAPYHKKDGSLYVQTAKEPNFKIIKSDVYPYDILVSIGNTYEQLKAKLIEELPENMHKEIKRFKKHHSARTVTFESGHTAINFNEINPGIIAHESFHAVDFIFHELGMTLSPDSDEAYAYFIHFVVNEITKFNESIKEE